VTNIVYSVTTDACSRPEFGWASWQEPFIGKTLPDLGAPIPSQPTHTNWGFRDPTLSRGILPHTNPVTTTPHTQWRLNFSFFSHP
jgi:hypothetical protein